ncbi:MAG: uroporphyrinogen decarboxylase family protein [Planctomycetota bacterium]
MPVDYSANPGIDRRLKEHFGLEAGDHEELRRELGVDFRSVAARYTGPRLHEEPEAPDVRVSPDWGLRTRYMKHDTGGYWEPWPGRLGNLDEETAASYPMPSPDDYDYAGVRARCEEFAGFAVAVPAQFEVMNWTGRHIGDESMYVGLALGDPALLTFIDRFVAIKYEVLRRTIEAAGGGIDIVCIGEDLGTQRGPRISTDMFRERIRPVHERFVGLAAEHGLPVMIHSCGSCSWAFDEFVDMGIACVDTLQPEAADMAPAYIKERWGDRLAFHGCISTAGPVATGTPEETEDYCRQTLEVMKPGGGYCFAPTHQLQDDSPTENVVAMYRAAREHGAY